MWGAAAGGVAVLTALAFYWGRGTPADRPAEPETEPSPARFPPPWGFATDESSSSRARAAASVAGTRWSSPGRARRSWSTTSAPSSTAAVDRPVRPARSSTRSGRPGGEAVANGDDVADWEGAQRLVQTAVDSFGRLDVLVNNAGLPARPDDRVDLRGGVGRGDPGPPQGPLRADPLRRRPTGASSRRPGEPVDGRVINTSSGAGLMGSVGQGDVQRGEGRDRGARRWSSRAELGRYGVTANAIAPAARTRMTEAVFAETMAAPEDDAFDAMAPENVAPLVVWLGSAESPGVTGRVFEVEGGILSVADGWQHGPRIDKGARWDPAELGPVVRRARSPRRAGARTGLRGLTYAPARMDDVRAYGVAAHARHPAGQGRVRRRRPAHHLRRARRRRDRAAHVLRARGVGPDARLGIALRNRPEWFVAALGAARLGAQVVPIPHGATRGRARVLLRRTARSRSCSTRTVCRTFLADGTPRRRPLRSPTRAPTTWCCARTRRARPAGRRRCCAPSGRPTRRSWAWCGTTSRTGSTRPDEVNLTALAAAPSRRVQRPAQRADRRPHDGAARPLRRGRSDPACSRRERVTYWICAPVHLYRLTRLPPPTCRTAADLSSVRRRACTAPRRARRASSAR